VRATFDERGPDTLRIEEGERAATGAVADVDALLSDLFG